MNWLEHIYEGRRLLDVFGNIPLESIDFYRIDILFGQNLIEIFGITSAIPENPPKRWRSDLNLTSITFRAYTSPEYPIILRINELSAFSISVDKIDDYVHIKNLGGTNEISIKCQVVHISEMHQTH
jgi:hypothetical protein